MPRQEDNSGTRSGAWCAFRLAARFHFSPFCPLTAPGRAKAVCTNQTLQVAGQSGRQQEKEEECALILWGQQEKRTRAKPTTSWWSQRQSKPAPRVCYTITYLTVHLHYVITFRCVCTRLQVARGESGTEIGWRNETLWGLSPSQAVCYVNMRGWHNRRGWNGEGQLLPWWASLLSYPKHGPLRCTWVPLASPMHCWRLRVGRGFSWPTEGRWEGRSWLPERLLLSSIRAETRTSMSEQASKINASLEAAKVVSGEVTATPHILNDFWEILTLETYIYQYKKTTETFMIAQPWWNSGRV